MRILVVGAYPPSLVNFRGALISELIASGHTLEEIRDFIGADSLAYLSLEGTVASVSGERDSYCLACWTGEYRVKPSRNDSQQELFPIRFDTFEKEYEALLNEVTVWDVAVERCVEIDGPDGFRLTQLMTPRDLSKCAVGQAKYVLICARDGGILNDPVLTRMSENKFWLTLASSDVLYYAKGLADAMGLDATVTEAEIGRAHV